MTNKKPITAELQELLAEQQAIEETLAQARYGLMKELEGAHTDLDKVAKVLDEHGLEVKKLIASGQTQQLVIDRPSFD